MVPRFLFTLFVDHVLQSVNPNTFFSHFFLCISFCKWSVVDSFCSAPRCLSESALTLHSIKHDENSKLFWKPFLFSLPCEWWCSVTFIEKLPCAKIWGFSLVALCVRLSCQSFFPSLPYFFFFFHLPPVCRPWAENGERGSSEERQILVWHLVTSFCLQHTYWRFKAFVCVCAHALVFVCVVAHGQPCVSVSVDEKLSELTQGYSFLQNRWTIWQNLMNINEGNSVERRCRGGPVSC